MRAIREGERPDGSDIDPFMPWKSLGRMTDTELRAINVYLPSLPPMPANWSGKVDLDLGLVATCPPDHLLCVEAWDQS